MKCLWVSGRAKHRRVLAINARPTQYDDFCKWTNRSDPFRKRRQYCQIEMSRFAMDRAWCRLQAVAHNLSLSLPVIPHRKLNAALSERIPSAFFIRESSWIFVKESRLERLKRIPHIGLILSVHTSGPCKDFSKGLDTPPSQRSSTCRAYGHTVPWNAVSWPIRSDFSSNRFSTVTVNQWAG